MSAQLYRSAMKPKDSKGMTLVELLIAMTMAIIVIGGIYVLLVQTNRASVGQSYAAEMQQNARIALELMTREILMAGYDPTNPDYLVLRIPPVLEPSSTVADPSSTQIRVLADLNQDGDALDADENVFYEWDSTTGELSRDSGSGPLVIAGNITDFGITFEPGASSLPTGAAAGATTLTVQTTAGFDIGDWVYVSDGVNLNNTFILGITGMTSLAINPALTNSFGADSTVGSVEKVTVSLTARTEKIDPQTRQFRTIDLVSEIALRNFLN